MFAMGPAFFKAASAGYATLALSGTFAAASVGVAYSSDLAISGGDGSYSNPRVTVGTLPAWATLSIVSGKLRLSGTPTGSATTVNITVAVDSGDGQTATSAQIFGVSSVSYTTLDPAFKGTSVALSGSDLVATAMAASAGLARAVKSLSGKMYFEMVFTAESGAGAVIAAGICDSSEPASAALGYSSANSWALWGTTPGVRHNGSTLVALSNVFSGSVIGVAFDAGAGKVWFRYNGLWLGTGSPDPATGTAPNYTGITGTIYPAACPWGSGAVVTARFDPATYRDAAPAGFGPVTA